MNEQKQRRRHRLDLRLNDEEMELLITSMELCNYTRKRAFAREVLCGFAMRAITRYTTPKVVEEVMSQSDASLS